MYILIITESESNRVYILDLRALFSLFALVSLLRLMSNVYYLRGKYIAIKFFFFSPFNIS